MPLGHADEPRESVSARDLVNGLPEDELARIIYEYGRNAGQSVLLSLLQHREAEPIETTGQLVQVIVCGACRARQKGPHPARRAFQALRIAVNDELGRFAHLQQSLICSTLGRIAVNLPFARIALKEFFNSCLGRCICPPELRCVSAIRRRLLSW